MGGGVNIGIRPQTEVRTTEELAEVSPPDQCRECRCLGGIEMPDDLSYCRPG